MKEPDPRSPPPSERRERRRWFARARQILLPGGNWLDDGAVWGEGPTVHGVESWSSVRGGSGIPSGAEGCDLGECLLLPGLINAHCHLDLGFLRGALPPGMPFADWLRALSPHIHGTSPETFRDAFRESVRELSSAGCVFIADIVRRTALAPPVKEFLPGVGFRLYQEMIDFQDDRAGQVVGEALAWIRSVCPPGVSVGLSPHAPYTVTEPLLGESMRAASREGIPLSIHCAETEEERRFCLEGTGPIRDLLDDGGYLAPGWRAPGCSPVAFLDRAGVLAPPRPGVPGALLVHLNAVDDVDLGILARRGASAVVCPGAHQYFQRGRFPLESLMKAGVSTALGTDGLSSNDVLSMWEEIRRALMLAPSLSAQQAVALATSEAARALGIDNRYGTIQPARAAAFCVVDTSFPAPELGAPAGREWLLTSGVTVRESLVFG